MAEAPIRDIIISQGTDWSETFQILDEAGDVLDLAIVTTARGEARRIADHLTIAAFVITLTIDLGTNTITASVARAITSALVVGPTKTHPSSKFFYDYELTFTSGVRDRIQQGTCIVHREITNI